MSGKLRLTRRDLFRGLGSATLVAGCKPTTAEPPPTTQPLLPGAPEGIAGVGPGPAPLALTLNGQPLTVEVAPNQTLLAVLRDHARATGTKEVCDRGACGACMVLVDGRPQNSCMTLAHDVAGRQVTTVEGLAPAGQLSPLQQAFHRHDAMQCGYCTPGMLVSCHALLQRKEGAVTRERVEQAISGNLCRCGTYPNIVAAVLDAAGKAG